MTFVAAAQAVAPFRPYPWMPRDLEVERKANGQVHLTSRVPLAPHKPHLGRYLDAAAAAAPDRTWLAERDPETDAWRAITYGEGKRKVDSLSQALLDLGGDRTGPLAILSGNSVAHGLLAMGAIQAGIPVAPVSTAYSLASQDHAKLRYIFDLLRPRAVFVEDPGPYTRALAALPLEGVPVISVTPDPAGRRLCFNDLAATPPTERVAKAAAALSGDTVAKFLFTSGSTGMPKAVINTHGMIATNIEMFRTCRPPEADFTCLDWMPWNHTMAGNAAFFLNLFAAGTYYIDDGRPTPELFGRTLRNIREVRPTSFMSAPVAFAALTVAMEQDPTLSAAFFERMQVMSYGGARLPDDLYDRIQALAVEATGQRVNLASVYGTTETAPLLMVTHWELERCGLIGLPVPGVELKLVPVEAKYELRARGPNVTPGYYGRPDLTEAAFDADGFYRTGDLVQFFDPGDPNEGLLFGGRLAEEFKLLTGTFVPTGAVRVDAVAAASPVLQDALVTGQDRDYVGLLAWPNLEACRRLAGAETDDASLLVRHPDVVAAVRDGLRALNADQGYASSRAIARVLLLTEPPCPDAGEITDKGYLNQRVGLARRADLVERLYQDPPPPDVIVVDRMVG